MARMVLLQHALPDGSHHYDWLIQPDGEDPNRPLITFRASRRVDEPSLDEFDVQRLPDHRSIYLNYQGPVSGGRGSVQRLWSIECQWTDTLPDGFEISTNGVTRFVFAGEATATDRYRVRRSIVSKDQAPAGADMTHEHTPDPFLDDDESPIPIETVGQSEAQQSSGSKIHAFSQSLSGKRHEEEWNRTPNVTGLGAIHVKSFHCKLTSEGLANLDRQVNEWLDAHPQYEVKQVTSSVGQWHGKSKEDNLILQVWV